MRFDLFEYKYDLGLFQDPYKYCDENRAKTEIFTRDHRAEARKIASLFLWLKQKKTASSLKKTGTIALIGPLADPRKIWRYGVWPLIWRNPFHYWQE
jgi:beta-glucosidase